MRQVDGHEGHVVSLTSGLSSTGEEIGVSACLTCMVVVRQVRLCGKPARARNGRPCRAFLSDNPEVEACPRHRPKPKQDAVMRPPTTAERIMEWFRMERVRWYTARDVVSGTGITQRAGERSLPRLVETGFLLREGGVGRGGARYFANQDDPRTWAVGTDGRGE